MLSGAVVADKPPAAHGVATKRAVSVDPPNGEPDHSADTQDGIHVRSVTQTANNAPLSTKESGAELIVQV